MKSRTNYQYQKYDRRYAYIRTLTMTQFAREYPEEVPALEKQFSISFAVLLLNENYNARLLHHNKKLVKEIGLPTDKGYHIPLIEDIPEDVIVERVDDTTVAVKKEYAAGILKQIPARK
ncbi:MAG: hypothetical protein K2J39_03770 [Ruminococcus sp.]|nr:hypothetical protein [Ruminococcus sp.]